MISCCKKNLFLTVLLFAPCFASADLIMGMDLEHQDYLLFESIKIAITIVNDTDEPMKFSEDRSSADINFVVEGQNYNFIFKKNKDRIVKDVTIMPDEKKIMTIDLTRWYPITSQGRYFISAEIEWNGKIYKTERKLIDVVSGIEIARVVRKLSGRQSNDRVYTLRYWQRNRQDNLFFLVEEPSASYHYGVFDLGPIVRVMKPELSVDRHGNIKIVHQSGINKVTETTLFSDDDEITYVGQTHKLIRSSAVSEQTSPSGIGR